MSHVAHIDESCHTYVWVMSHICMSHVTHMKESCRTYERVLLHISTSHVAHINESCHTYEWVMSHIWMSQGTHQHSIVLRRIKLVTQINKCCPTDANITWRLSFFPQTIQACRIGVSHVTHKRHVTHISNMSHVRIGCVTPKKIKIAGRPAENIGTLL